MINTTRGILQLDGVTLKFGAVVALDNVSLQIDKPEILAIIGPNGAGKTCTINSISGFYRPSAGSIYLFGEDVSRCPSYKIADMGVSRTFQNIELYTGLTTLDNLMAARHLFIKYGFLMGGLYFGPARREEARNRRIVEEIIDFLEMEAIRKKVVGTLPYGLRKRVELGRALALEPRLLLLDEPMAGMSVEEKEDMARFILDIYEEKNIPIIIIEHDMGLVLDIADRIAVLDFGKKIAEGLPEQIITNPEVINAYLGNQEAEFAASTT